MRRRFLRGLSQISGVDGSSGTAVDFTLRCRGVAHDPECDCRAAEAPVEGRLQRPALRGVAHPAGRELDDTLGLTDTSGESLADVRTGKNGRDRLAGLPRLGAIN